MERFTVRLDKVLRFNTTNRITISTACPQANWSGQLAEAKFEDGVLRLTLPKPERLKPKQIEVKVA